MSRITRDQMFMEIARSVAARGTCDRARVGAVLVNPQNNIVSIGYNGSPPGEPHCDEAGHLMYHNHCMRTAHAEENCIDRAVCNFPIGATFTMYVTHYPCVKCQATLYEWCRNHGIKLLVMYGKMYRIPTALEGLKELSEYIQFTQYQGDQLL